MSRIGCFGAAAGLTALAAGVSALTVSAAHAGETITYSYDAKGRLVQVARTSGVTTDYAFDKADNRISKTVTGGAAPIAGFSYEAPEVGSGFLYNPSLEGSVFASQAGIAGNGSAWGFLPAPDGDQVVFLQTHEGNIGSLTQSVAGLTPGAGYTLSFMLARRPGFGANPISVSADGVSLGTFTPTSDAFVQFTTPAFQAVAATASIVFSGQPEATTIASGLDKLSVIPAGPPPLPGFSFETPEMGSGFAYNPSVPGAVFASNAGIAGNGSAWGFTAAPDGDQVAFLQSYNGGIGTLTQSVEGLTQGASYTLSFSLAQRPGYGSNPIAVSVNGVSLGTFTPGSSAFTRFTTAAFQAGSGPATIVFTGTAPSGDGASALDAVAIGQ